MKRNISSGLLLLVLGVCLVLWKMNVLPLPTIAAGVGAFGMIIAFIMVTIILWGLVNLTFSAVFFPLAILCIIFKEPLGIEKLTPWTVLIVAALFTAAMNMLLPSAKRLRYNFDKRIGATDSTNDFDTNHRYVFHSTSFSEATRYIRSNALEEVDLKVKFGELSVYLDDVCAPTGTVSIDCSASFGEMNVYVPKDWYVENKVSVAMGEVTDNVTKEQGDPNGTRCLITGSVFCGELVLKRI